MEKNIYQADSNKLLILEEFENCKGQFVITAFSTIERLIGILDDGEDYYYAYYNGSVLTFDSCVGYFIPLKNQLDKKYYDILINNAKYNHKDQEMDWINKDEFLNKSLGKNDKFITEICWDLN